MKRKRLSKSEKRDLSNSLEYFGFDLYLKKEKLEKVKLEDIILFYDLDSKRVICFKRDGILYPSIHTINSFDESMKKVEVDKGAVKPISNGANLMVPGIKNFDVFKKGEVVKIMYQDTPIAIGESLMSSEDLDQNDNGVGINSIHHIKDDIWDFSLD
ncbi:MAG: PUA domain-containing protein [Candidatus Woesearchaeota archaeon]